MQVSILGVCVSPDPHIWPLTQYLCHDPRETNTDDGPESKQFRSKILLVMRCATAPPTPLPSTIASSELAGDNRPNMVKLAWQ